MYSFEWDSTTGGYLLSTQSGKYVANEIRPVFAPELELTGLAEKFSYKKNETKRPFLWAQKNVYYLNGEKVAQANRVQFGKPISLEYFFDGKKKLTPVDVKATIKKNADVMDALVADTKRRIKELYDGDVAKRDIAYIAFSGGKDSVALLDICHQVLPFSTPVVFSDTGMELPGTYDVWERVQARYPGREFIKASAATSALEDWRTFGPPARTIRWCCSVRKSAPAIFALKEKLNKTAIKTMAFVGVRGDESYSRSFYEDRTDGAKNASQLNLAPLLNWSAHELWLYIFRSKLEIHRAYLSGLSRVGCILCPESSEKYIWYVDQIYPNLLQPYRQVLLDTIAKVFKNQTEGDEFIGQLNWQARKSGAVLKKTLNNAVEDTHGLTTTFRSEFFTKHNFFEWVKTLGFIIKEPKKNRWKIIPSTKLGVSDFSFSSIEMPEFQSFSVSFHFHSRNDQKKTLALVLPMLRKAAACVGCRSCEAECAFGAIRIINQKITIDETKCTQCRKCYDVDYGCWRFFSMRTPEKTTSAVATINNYKKFGLREKGQDRWISALILMKENFFPWNNAHPIGNKMVESASAWFRQAELIDETRKPTPLLRIFEEFGGASELGWEFIWCALANRSTLIKWFITSTEIGKKYTIDDFVQMLKERRLGESTIDGGLIALKDLASKSPFGDPGALALIETENKGRSIIGLTRRPRVVDPLTLLYGLYTLQRHNMVFFKRLKIQRHKRLDFGLVNGFNLC